MTRFWNYLRHLRLESEIGAMTWFWFMNQFRTNRTKYWITNVCVCVALLYVLLTLLVVYLPYYIFCIIWRNQDLVTKWCRYNKSTVCTRAFRTCWNNKYINSNFMNAYRGILITYFKPSHFVSLRSQDRDVHCHMSLGFYFLCSIIWGQR